MIHSHQAYAQTGTEPSPPKRTNVWKSTLYLTPMIEGSSRQRAVASLRDYFLFFFDNVAFADNPDWSDCYCSAYENPFRS